EIRSWDVPTAALHVVQYATHSAASASSSAAASSSSAFVNGRFFMNTGLLVCVVNVILAQCQHVVNRFFGAGRSFFASSGAAVRTCWHGVGTVWGAHPPRPRRRAPAGPWDP